jgi:AcrR family transcriptional regulator
MGRPRQIDRPAILAASLALADGAGLAAVTMQAVAERLGVSPMALYHHVDGKADLVDGVVECLLAELPRPSPRLAWDAQLAALGQGLRVVARRHPSVFPLLLQRPAVTIGARLVRGYTYAVLREAGVAPRHIVRVERLISTLAIGFAAGEASGRFPGSRAALDAEYRALVRFVRAGIEPFRARRETGSSVGASAAGPAGATLRAPRSRRGARR